MSAGHYICADSRPVDKGEVSSADSWKESLIGRRKESIFAIPLYTIMFKSSSICSAVTLVVT